MDYRHADSSAEAKAHPSFQPFAARLKSCPYYKAAGFQKLPNSMHDTVEDVQLPFLG